MTVQNKLPIGSVVLLKGGLKKVMIIGFFMNSKIDNITYDYSGCIYPEGFLSNNKLILFNENQIDKVLYMGLIDNDELELKNNLIKMPQVRR